MTNEQDKKPGRYDFTSIEAKWQRYWEERATFRTLNPGEPGADASKPKFYILDMFPYPSGAGLHVGHPIGYCATDIVARYKRMRGFNVLHPMGFDAFGLPAEQYAIETNVHPAVTTQKNIEMYRRQLKMFGFSYDWSRELATCEPGYYRWTQWMFARMYESWYDDEQRWTGPEGCTIVGRARPIAELVAELESGRWAVDATLTPHPTLSPQGERGLTPSPSQGESRGEGRAVLRPWASLSANEKRRAIDRQRLAYIDDVAVNWCPALGTVLANEEVDNEGRSDRGGHPVFRRPLRQWMLRITKYAERLLTDLDGLDWPEPIKLMQRNWVGKSVGAEVVFPLIPPPQGVGHPDHCSQSSGTPGDGIRIYTTRPDTLFGATYMVLAPEHPLVERITTKEFRAEVARYVEAATRKSDMTRTTESKEKTGVFTGAYAINPVNAERIPIWIADYVLMGYGTGAIMAVPGSDERDFEFAKQFRLPIVPVVRPDDTWLRDQLRRGAFDQDYCTRRGRGDLPERLMRSAVSSAGVLGGVTGQDARAVLDGDASWIQQVALPVFAEDPGVFAEPFVADGRAMNSPGPGTTPSVPGGVCVLNGLSTEDAKKKITAWLEANGLGRATVNYKLRDWLFSRQRYWGEPFPVLHGEDGETIVVGDDELPVELPPMKKFKPTPSADDAASLPEPPLGRAPRGWVSVTRDGRRFRRDVNTMPQWAGSCWYYLRFIDPRNAKRFCDPQAEKYWMPIDLYVGGAEHAVLHLLYARFWHKVLYDLGFVSTREPFNKLFNQGMIQSFAYRDEKRGVILSRDQVDEKVGKVSGQIAFFIKGTDDPAPQIIAKMSKSLKNVVNPDEVIHEYGADTFRLYEMYMGPLETSKPWNTRDVPGLFKLCQRIWRLFVDESSGELSGAMTDDPPDPSALRALHKMTKRVTEDIEALKFNTAIAAIFDFVNAMTPMTRRSRAVLEPFVLVLSPFAPHLAEELWSRLGHGTTLAYERWPAFDVKLARDEQVEIAVQVGGKIKSRVMVAADADEATSQAAALADPKVVAAIGGKPIRKVIVAKGRLVNILL
jgi:leucyl-tRNA synthetase